MSRTNMAIAGFVTLECLLAWWLGEQILSNVLNLYRLGSILKQETVTLEDIGYVLAQVKFWIWVLSPLAVALVIQNWKVPLVHVAWLTLSWLVAYMVGAWTWWVVFFALLVEVAAPANVAAIAAYTLVLWAGAAIVIPRIRNRRFLLGWLGGHVVAWPAAVEVASHYSEAALGVTGMLVLVAGVAVLINFIPNRPATPPSVPSP